MKLKLKIVLSLLLCGILISFSWNTKSTEFSPKTSLLWKIEGNGMKNPSYLFGTMHLIQKDFFYFPNSLEKIIKKSNLIVTEISLDRLNDQQEAMKYIYLKEGNLLDFFNLEQQDSLLDWAKIKLNLDKETFLSVFGKMKPFLITQTIVQMSLLGKTESYEMKIHEIAIKNKIALEGLESIEQQISFFDNLTKAKQAQLVMEGIKDEEKSLDLMNKMQGVYKRQQLDSLYIMINEEGGVISEEQSVFLDNRNTNWIPQLIQLMKTNEKLFIAVGAGHLAGDKGIINLLDKEGYKLTPIIF